MKNTASKYLLFLFTVFLVSCAQMAIPTGGDKDVQPPQIVSEKTIPQNRSVNFTGKNILITFDEFVKLNNPQQQVIISPAPEKEPEYVLNGKRLTIRFKEELKVNTTYTINFGNAISDITENNVAENLLYIFSTGNFIDSMRVDGVVKNAFTKSPEKGIWVSLYENENDILTKRPMYVSKTDKNGNFSIQNISAGEYFIYALKDDNNNYLYDRPSEQIAFLNEKINVNNENSAPLTFLLFKENNEKQFIKKTIFEYPDKFTFIFNKPLVYNEPSVEILSPGGYKIDMSFAPPSRDSVFVWIDWRMLSDSAVFSVEAKTDSFADTITVYTADDRTAPDSIFTLKHNITPVFGLYDTIQLWYKHPFDTEFTKGIQLFEDSIEIKRKVQTVGLVGNKLIILAEFKERTKYRLLVARGALEDINYESVNDTLDISFTTQKEEHYGNLFLSFSSENNLPFFLQLKNDKGKVVREIYPGNDPKINFEKLPPGNYSISALIDENENRKWDTGNLGKKIQPERIYYYDKPVTIRSNWDVDIDWKLLLK